MARILRLTRLPRRIKRRRRATKSLRPMRLAKPGLGMRKWGARGVCGSCSARSIKIRHESGSAIGRIESVRWIARMKRKRIKSVLRCRPWRLRGSGGGESAVHRVMRHLVRQHRRPGRHGRLRAHETRLACKSVAPVTIGKNRAPAVIRGLKSAQLLVQRAEKIHRRGPLSRSSSPRRWFDSRNGIRYRARG